MKKTADRNHPFSQPKREKRFPIEDPEIYRRLFDMAPIGIGMSDLKGRVLNMNPAMEKITGYSREELLGIRLETMYADPGGRRKLLAALRAKGVVRNFEALHKRKGGAVFWARINVDPIVAPGRRFFLTTVMDVTPLKQTESRARKDAERNAILLSFYDKAARLSDKEFNAFALDKAVRLTDSKIGFFLYLSNDQTAGTLTAWNSEALKNCTSPYESHFSLDKAGNWADCVRLKKPVIYNDYSSSPNQRGLPHGHSPVKRFLSVPVIEEGKVRIVFGVGNKAGEYDEADVLQLQILAAELHKIIGRLRVQDALLKSEEQLHQFSQRIIAVREEENKRIAATLHHDIGSLSVGVSARLNATEDEIRARKNVKALALLEESRKTFEDAVGRLKNLAAELRPPGLDILGLPAALRQHFVQQTRDGAVRILFTDATKGVKIPERISTALFRVAQESLTNVIRHAGAKQVWVRLSEIKEGIRFSLRDDGAGFDLILIATGRGRHFGLQAMEETVSSLGGRFIIRSRPGRGTEVIALIPKGDAAP